MARTHSWTHTRQQVSRVRIRGVRANSSTDVKSTLRVKKNILQYEQRKKIDRNLIFFSLYKLNGIMNIKFRVILARTLNVEKLRGNILYLCWRKRWRVNDDDVCGDEISLRIRHRAIYGTGRDGGLGRAGFPGTPCISGVCMCGSASVSTGRYCSFR